MRQSSESLAGRAAYVELATIVAGELPGTREDTTDRRNAVTVSRGLRLACDVLQPRQAFLVHGGSGEWPAGDLLWTPIMRAWVDTFVVAKARRLKECHSRCSVVFRR